jgi:hypothetical protein
LEWDKAAFVTLFVAEVSPGGTVYVILGVRSETGYIGNSILLMTAVSLASGRFKGSASEENGCETQPFSALFCPIPPWQLYLGNL